jgi:Clathrin-H-link/Clathrin, heavy-chain linker/Clathrin propeller repeat
MQVSKKHGIVYLATKYGFIHLYDLESGACIYMNRISGDTIFVATEHEATNGILCINRKGQVLGVSVDEQTMVPYILATLNNTELAFKLASRGNLPGADDLYIKQYQSLFQAGQYNEAAKIAANSPNVCLFFLLCSSGRDFANTLFIGHPTHRTNYRLIQTGTCPSWRSISHPSVLRHPLGEGRT